MKFKSAAIRLSEAMSMIEQEYADTPQHHHQQQQQHKSMDEESLTKRAEEDQMEWECDPSNFESFFVPRCSPRKEQDWSTTIPGDHHLRSFSLFDKALTIPSHLCPDRDRDYTVICCILLYNYGLSNHLMGLVSGSDDRLEEALLSYEMALGFVSVVEQGTLPLVLELALLNNCSHIHSLHFSTWNVHACLQRMHMLLMTLYMTRKVPQTELSPFSVNVVYNAGQYERPAPAA